MGSRRRLRAVCGRVGRFDIDEAAIAGLHPGRVGPRCVRHGVAGAVRTRLRRQRDARARARGCRQRRGVREFVRSSQPNGDKWFQRLVGRQYDNPGEHDPQRF